MVKHGVLHKLIFVVVSVSVFTTAKSAAPVIDGSPVVVTLRRDVKSDVRVYELRVTDADNDIFTCNLQNPSPSFTVTKRFGDTAFSVYFIYSNANGLTDSQYFLDVTCTDGTETSISASVRVDIINNSPPIPMSGSTSTSYIVDIARVFLPESLLQTIGATDPDGDFLACTATPPAGFVVGADCSIRNQIDLRSLAITDTSKTVVVNVSDGVNAPVVFTTLFTFTNHNQPPKFAAHSSSQLVMVDVTSSATLFEFEVTDDQAFTVTWSVNPSADRTLFSLDNSDRSVKLAPGKTPFDASTSMRSVVITCTADDGFMQSSSSVTLSLSDANNAPVLSPTTFAVVVDEGPPNSVHALLPISVLADPGVPGDTYTYSVNGTYSSSFTFGDITKSDLTNLLTLDAEGSPVSPFNVLVVVTDKGGKTATATAVVTIRDVNDNDPICASSSYTFSVYSGMPSGTVLGTLSATDLDLSGVNKQIDFSISTSLPANKFSIGRADGRLQLTSDVTESYGTVFSARIMVTDRGSPSRSSACDVTLEWNKAPVITSLPAIFNIPEDPTVTTLLHTLVTSDAESDPVTCQITDITPSWNTFQVQNIPGTSSQGIYYTGVKDLSVTTSSSYVITVTASDGKGGKSSKTLTLNVMPNQKPVSSCADRDSISVSVATSFAVNTVVYSLTVTDPENDDIKITTAMSPNSGTFLFDSVTRKVKVGRDLRLENVMSHTLTFTITDNVNPSMTCTLAITITEPNQPPVFTAHGDTVSFQEDVSALTTLFDFDIKDDTPFTVNFYVSPPSSLDLFVFDKTAFTVKLASGQSFDFETKPKAFVITCTADDGFLQATSSVTVSILDTNEAPYFQQAAVDIRVNEGPAATVSFVPAYSVHDPDSADTVTYSLVPGTYSSFFSINSVDGRLTNLETLERDPSVVDPITVQVKAVDKGGLSATAEVKIYLDDVNDNTPLFEQTSYEFKVGLSTKLGDLIGSVSATDIDYGNNAIISLNMTSQNPKGYFTLEPDGRLFLSKTLDVAYGTLFSLNVEAQDKGTPARTATTVISILWNQGPQILNLPDLVTCHEDIQVKTKLFDLNEIDVESDKYVCVKSAISPTTSAFDVEEVTGNSDFAVFYTASAKLSANDVSRYDLSVKCNDINGESTKVLTILITHNTAPVLPCTPTASITVDALVTGNNIQVYSAAATDVENDPVTYSMTSSSVFYIGQYTGSIRTLKSLRTATTDQYSLLVSAADLKHTTYCTLVVLLTNTNKVPEFSNLPYTVEVPETTAAGTPLYVISVVDPNVLNGITFEWSSDSKSKFEVTTSGLTATLKLRSGEELDYESNKKIFTFTFTASDGYLTSLPQTLTLIVTPVNEPPYFFQDTLFRASFLEIFSPPEVASLGCHIIDPDDGDVVKLKLTGTHADLFTISDLDNCRLTLISEFDLDNGYTSPVTLTITATDKGGLSATASVIVTIIEINDNNPEFSGPMSFTAERGFIAGDTIGVAAATDKDSGTNGAISYSIVTQPDNADEAAKYITFLSTGKFVMRQSMDDAYTSSENFRYVIKATDYGTPSRSSTTTVNIIYDPFVTTTTTSTTQMTTTTSEVTSSTTEANSSLSSQPWFIGMLSSLIVLGCILGAGAIFLLCKYFSGKKTHNSSYESSRSSTPLRPNRISVQTADSPMTGSEGRKISKLMPLPSSFY